MLPDAGFLLNSVILNTFGWKKKKKSISLSKDQALTDDKKQQSNALNFCFTDCSKKGKKQTKTVLQSNINNKLTNVNWDVLEKSDHIYAEIFLMVSQTYNRKPPDLPVYNV